MTTPSSCFFFFFNDTATTEIYTLSLHDALPICDAALDRQSNQFDGGANAELLTHDGGGVGDRLVGGLDQPRNLGETFPRAEQAQDLHLARGELGQRALRERRSCEGDASRHRGRQIGLALAD